MAISARMLKSELDAARNSLRDAFVAQCQDGAQTRSLRSGDIAACGQFIDAHETRQRGLYGTSAAIAVLATGTSATERKLTRRLIAYVGQREEVEGVVEGRSGETPQRVQRDRRNVIKQAELLFSLSCIGSTAEVVGVGAAIAAGIQASLRNGALGGQGWGYFLDETETTIEPLATAYAYRALTATGGWEPDSEDRCRRYLFKHLDLGGDEKSSIERELAIQVLILYVLTFWGSRDDEKSQRQLAFGRLWRRYESLLLYGDLEQNVEYWSGSATYYVRVPWQLYLLALAAEYSPVRRFGSVAARKRLESAIRSAKGQGLVYPHSGSKPSARTNAILYEVLGLIQPRLSPYLSYLGGYLIDRMQLLLSSRWVVGLALLGASLISAVAVVRWYVDNGELADLAPEVLGSVLVFLLSVRKTR